MRYFDAHCDTITKCMEKDEGLWSNSCHIDLLKALEFSAYAQVMAIWINDDIKGSEASERFFATYEYFSSQLEKLADKISVCRSANDYHTALLMKKVPFFLAAEGCHVFGGNIDNIGRLYDMGVRICTITWNADNELASGCMSPNDKGLSALGRRMLSEMIKRKIIIDLSHIGERGFWDIVSLGGACICSHSNLKSVHDHPRNITDEQFRALAGTGGGCGINLYPAFIGGNGFEDIYRHVERFMELGGEDSLFIGADFDGVDSLPDGIRTVKDIGALYDFFIRKNMGIDLLDKLFYRNLERIITSAIG